MRAPVIGDGNPPAKGKMVTMTNAAKPTIRFYSPDGTLHEVEGLIHDSVMDAAMDNDIPGILADCGGQAECGTCHVYVDEASFPLVGEATGYEAETLEDVKAERLPTSRLSCQLRIRPDFDGFTVRIAPVQV